MQKKFIVLSVLVLCLLTSHCLAASIPEKEQRVTCGDYSYVLPEGFIQYNVHRENRNRLYLNEGINSVPGDISSEIICITMDKLSDADFIADAFEFVMISRPGAKDDYSVRLHRYDIDIKNNIHLFTFVKLSLTKSDMDFGRYLIELNSSGHKQHTFIFVHDFYSLQRRKENIEKNLKKIGLYMKLK